MRGARECCRRFVERWGRHRLGATTQRCAGVHYQRLDAGVSLRAIEVASATTLLPWLGSAPLCSRICTVSAIPHKVARYSGVQPNYSRSASPILSRRAHRPTRDDDRALALDHPRSHRDTLCGFRGSDSVPQTAQDSKGYRDAGSFSSGLVEI